MLVEPRGFCFSHWPRPHEICGARIMAPGVGFGREGGLLNPGWAWGGAGLKTGGSGMDSRLWRDEPQGRLDRRRFWKAPACWNFPKTLEPWRYSHPLRQ